MRVSRVVNVVCMQPRVLGEKLLIYDAPWPRPIARWKGRGRGREGQKSFPGDQERSISTIRYFVSSARLLCERPYKKKLREGSSAVALARQRVRDGGRGRENPWKDIRRRFQERDSDSFSSRKTGY